VGSEVRGLPRDPSLGAAPPASPGPDPGRAGARSVGAWLKRQRELRGISLDELAARTRIPRRSLERLEAGCHDALADGFARGFVRTVGEALGLDPDEAVVLGLGEPVGGAVGRGARLALPPRVLAALAALVGLALLGVAWPDLLPAGWTGRPDPAAEVVRRRDVVREIAAEQGIPLAEPRGRPGGEAP